jgi:hypothetical protein
MGFFKKRKATTEPTPSKASTHSVRHSYFSTSKSSKEIGRSMNSITSAGTQQNNVSVPIETQTRPPPPPDPTQDPVAYLKCLVAVRERSNIVKDKALKNDLNHFDVDMTKFSQTVKWVVSIIKVYFSI